jgi:hypothetical protein
MTPPKRRAANMDLLIVLVEIGGIFGQGVGI